MAHEERVTSVSEAMAKRHAVRAFLPDAVPTETISACLVKAARSPSGSNLQPWRICVVNGEAMTRFRSIMEERLAGTPHPAGEEPEYDVYPPSLKEPYRTARFEIGEAMYGLLGIPREDKPARLRWFAENFRFFGAPAAIFCFIDRTMGPPQWSDLGMFLQSFMLLLEEAGLQSCPQECWYRYPRTVSEFCKVPQEWMLFCGVAIGHADPDAAVNRLRTNRLDTREWLSVL